MATTTKKQSRARMPMTVVAVLIVLGLMLYAFSRINLAIGQLAK